MNEAFERTTCACDSCTVGCRTMPGALIPGDLERIAEYTGHKDDKDWVMDHFVSSEGAKVALLTPSDSGSQLVQRHVPSIVPAQREDGACVFLNDHGLCSIHEVAPYCCSHFDSHMPEDEAYRRSKYGILLQLDAHCQGGSYTEWCKQLSMAGKLASPIAQRNARYRQKFAEIEDVKE